MASAAFIAAAAAATREPVILVAVESVDTIKTSSSSQADWQAAKASSNVNAVTQPGDLFLATDGSEVYSGTYTDDDAYTGRLDIYWSEGWPGDGTGVATAYSTSRQSPNNRTTGIRYYYEMAFNYIQCRVVLQYSTDGSTWSDGATITYNMNNSNDQIPQELSVAGLTPGTYYSRLMLDTINYYYGGGDATLRFLSGGQTKTITWSYLTSYLASGSLQTKNFDLGLVPSQDSVIYIDDSIPDSAGIAYTARGSNDGSSWTNLGTVTDTTALDPYRYYDVTATLTPSTSGLATPLLREIAIYGGDSQFVYYSTHPGEPVAAALPLVTGQLGTISAKIELDKLPSVGETSVSLFYCQPTFELLRDGQLRNKTVAVKVGFLGLAELDYEPYFTGIWHDASVDQKKGLINVKIRSPLAKFAKVQLPIELAENAARNNTTVAPITWTSVHAMDLAIDIYDQMGIPDRFIDRATFTAAETAMGVSCTLSRTLDKDHKAEAAKLLDEICKLTGVWFVPDADGKIKAIRYDPTAAIVADLDARVVDFGQVELGQEKLYTRQHIYYGLIAGEQGSAAEDFANAYVLINDAAEIAWGVNLDVPETDPDYRKNPGYSREFFDLWSMSQTAREAMADRWDSWYSTPKMKLKASNIPLAYFEIRLGQLVGVTGLQLPVTGLDWGELTSAKKFLVTGRTFDPKNCTLALDLLEV